MVLDAAGSERAVVLAGVEMSPVGLLLAASHPDRVEALVVVNAYARVLVDAAYPIGLPADVIAQLIGAFTDPSPAEGTDDPVIVVAPSAAHDPHFRKWWDGTGRRGASPATARALLQLPATTPVALRPVGLAQAGIRVAGTQQLCVPLEIRSGSASRAIGPAARSVAAKTRHSERSRFMSVTSVTRYPSSSAVAPTRAANAVSLPNTPSSNR